MTGESDLWPVTQSFWTDNDRLLFWALWYYINFLVNWQAYIWHHNVYSWMLKRIFFFKTLNVTFVCFLLFMHFCVFLTIVWHYNWLLYDATTDRCMTLQLTIVWHCHSLDTFSAYPCYINIYRYNAHTYNFFVFPHWFGPIDSRFSCQVWYCSWIVLHYYDLSEFQTISLWYGLFQLLKTKSVSLLFLNDFLIV